MLCFQTGPRHCLWQCTVLYQELFLLKISFQVCKMIPRYNTGTSICRWFCVSFSWSPLKSNSFHQMKVKVTQLCPIFVIPWTIQSMEFSRPEFWAEFWSGQPFPSPGDIPNPGIKPRSPTLQVDSLPAEPQGKPKNTGVGSLSLLQQIFLTQESNQGLLHCRQILYQLSYQGRPKYFHKILIIHKNKNDQYQVIHLFI